MLTYAIYRVRTGGWAAVGGRYARDFANWTSAPIPRRTRVCWVRDGHHVDLRARRSHRQLHHMWPIQAACGTYRLPVLEVAACMYRRALFVAPPHVAHTCYLSCIYLSPPRHGDGKRGRAKEREVGDVGRTTMRHGMEKT